MAEETTNVGGANSEQPLASAVSCPHCGAPVEPGESFCIRCGKPFADSPGEADEDRAAEPPAEVEPAPAPTPVTPPDQSVERSEPGPEPTAVLTPPVLPHVQAAPEERPNWKPRAIAAGVVALLLAITLAFAIVAWQMERSAHHKASDELSASRAQAESLQSTLADTRARLQRTEAISARQQVILRRTAAVLASVDPLLSGADELQRMTSGIQDDRDNFSYVSQQLVDDMVTVANDIINGASSSGVDLSYLSGEIDNVNNEIDNVRAVADTLSSSDASYGAASDRFGNRATAFTTAVRRLQRELRKLKAQ